MECGSTGNTLLDWIARADRTAASVIRNQALCIDFTGCQTLQRAGERIEFCYFPNAGVLTLVCAIDDETDVTTSAMGFDGAIHAAAGIDLNAAAHHVVSRLPGRLWQVNATFWQTLLDENRTVRTLIAQYTDFLFALMNRTLACRMRHDVEFRFCRWILELDRLQHRKPLAITHQSLSQLIGVRRTTITLMAQSLQDAGIISYRRGIIEVTDWAALEQASCQCHLHFRVVPEFDRSSRGDLPGAA